MTSTALAPTATIVKSDIRPGGYLTIRDGDVAMSISFLDYRDRPKTTRVYIDDALADRVDAALAALTAAEAALPTGRRWSTKGEFPEVDALYRRLNRRIAKVKRDLAVAAIARFDEQWAPATKGARFSANAGCTTCSCSPGVVLSGTISFDGYSIEQVWFSVAE